MLEDSKAKNEQLAEQVCLNFILKRKKKFFL
jgi:hypothetical protein